MTLPPQVRLRVEHELNAYCRRKNAELVKDGITYRFRVRGSSITVIRTEPGFPGFPESVDLPVAQLRYAEAAKRWTLYCADRNGRWHYYFDSDPTTDFRNLLRDVDEDPTGIFGS